MTKLETWMWKCLYRTTLLVGIDKTIVSRDWGKKLKEFVYTGSPYARKLKKNFAHQPIVIGDEIEYCKRYQNNSKSEAEMQQTTVSQQLDDLPIEWASIPNACQIVKQMGRPHKPTNRPIC